jgi:glycosyltransferase involved in cell wall biosynthesis
MPISICVFRQGTPFAQQYILIKHPELFAGALVKPSPLVNIVVTSFNRKESTRRCLESIRKHTKTDHALTVVDNGSVDGSAEMLEKLKAEGMVDHLFLLKRNMGVSPAANLGWAAVDAPFMVKFDNDVEVLKAGWLSRLLEVQAQAPEVGVLAYDVWGYDIEAQHFPGGALLRPAKFCGGSCALIPKSVHEKLGYWCEDYHFYGHEDSDYGCRVRQAGLYNAFMLETDFVRHRHTPYNHPSGRLIRSKEFNEDSEATFYANTFMYQSGIRPLFVGRRYVPLQKGKMWEFRVDPDYMQQAEYYKTVRDKHAEAFAALGLKDIPMEEIVASSLPPTRLR